MSMRHAFGALALTAAIVIVGYSAMTLFTAAFTSMGAPWAAWLAGIGIAAVVAWEAGAALLIGNCFRSRHYAIGLGAMVLLVLAMGLTFRYELRLHVAGQADQLAQREDASERRADMRTELDKARERRDALSKLQRPTPAQREQLRAERERIHELETQWSTRTVVVAEAMPEAALAARLTGTSEALWRDIWLVIPLGFWMLARVFAMPLAVVGMMAFRSREDGPGAAKAYFPLRPCTGVPGRPDLTRKIIPTNADGTPLDLPPGDAAKPVAHDEPKLAIKAKEKPHLVVSNPTPKNSMRGPVHKWREERLEQSSMHGAGISTKRAWEDYCAWCASKGYGHLGLSPFGKQLNSLGMRRDGKVEGSFRPGWKLKAA